MLNFMNKQKRADTTVAINGERNTRLQKAALEISISKQKIFKMSEVVQYLIDNYLDDAVKDLKSQSKGK